jgi:hypothetical protein
VRFEVLKASNIKMRVFWDVALCSLAGVERRFGRAYCVNHQGDKTSVYSNKSTRRYIPKDSHIQDKIQVFKKGGN